MDKLWCHFPIKLVHFLPPKSGHLNLYNEQKLLVPTRFYCIVHDLLDIATYQENNGREASYKLCFDSTHKLIKYNDQYKIQQPTDESIKHIKNGI